MKRNAQENCFGGWRERGHPPEARPVRGQRGFSLANPVSKGRPLFNCQSLPFRPQPRPRPRCSWILSTRWSCLCEIWVTSLRRERFCVRGGRAKPARHAHKTLSWHGARTSAPRRSTAPSAAKVQPNFVHPSDSTLRENCFWWVRAGRSPARTHQKLLLCTGRKRQRPAKARTRPPPITTFSYHPGIQPFNRPSLLHGPVRRQKYYRVTSFNGKESVFEIVAG